MALERILVHRLIRLLQLVIPLLVAVLIAIPAWNYVTRRAELSPQEHRPEQLPDDLAVRTEGFTFSRTEGGRTLFTIRARRNLGFKDNRNMLEDVEVIVYGSTEQEPARKIRSKLCAYDQATQDIRFEGAVEVQLDDRTTVRTEELNYNHKDRVAASPKRTFIEQPGTVAGQANGFEYGLDSGLLKLTGSVQLETSPNTTLQTEFALFHQKENWTSMTGGVLMKTQKGWIRGMSGRADLQPGTYQPKLITIGGNVMAESQGQAAADLWKLQTDWLEAAISDSGDLKQVKTRGNVELTKAAAGAKEVLTASEVDASLNSSGAVDLLHARQDARMTFGSDRTLRSNELWINSAQSINTGDNSVLQVGPSTIEGRQFIIEQGEAITFRTTHPASLRSGTQQSSADQTQATFDSRTNTFRELVQTGNFKFKDSQYEGSAQKARFEEGGAVVTLEGTAVVTDVEKRLEAAEIRLNQKNNSFVATRNVRSFIKNTADPLRVQSARAEGNAESMLYTGAAELWGRAAYIRAESIKATGLGKSNNLYAEGKGQSRVQTDFNTIRTTSDTLDYDNGRGIAHYTGSVRARKQDMILETPDLTVKLGKDKALAEVTASGGVAVTRGDGSGTGQHALYDAATDLVTLTGNPAQIHDKVRGNVKGARFVMKSSGETVLVEGGRGGRTETRHPVRK